MKWIKEYFTLVEAARDIERKRIEGELSNTRAYHILYSMVKDGAYRLYTMRDIIDVKLR